MEGQGQERGGKRRKKGKTGGEGGKGKGGESLPHGRLN